MAQKEKIRDRIEKLDPKVVAAADAIEKTLMESGCTNMVTLTEDMTPEEEEMALYEALLKEGCPEGEAATKAKEQQGQFKRIFGR